MIKAVGRNKLGVPQVFLGLSDENWKRLREGQPILVSTQALDPDLPAMQIVLLGGETEDSLVEDLRALGAKS